MDDLLDEQAGFDESEDERSNDNGDARAPGSTQREAAYLKELVQNQTPVEVKLRSGETVSGFIEYYDKRFIRLTREGAPNLFIFKTDILYLCEAGARPPHPGGRRKS